jgi:hypothetical protein
MTKQAFYVSAASLAAIMIVLPACSSSGDPAPDAGGPPLFQSTPGDVVQSPGNYVPVSDRPYRGN